MGIRVLPESWSYRYDRQIFHAGPEKQARHFVPCRPRRFPYRRASPRRAHTAFENAPVHCRRLLAAAIAPLQSRSHGCLSCRPASQRPDNRASLRLYMPPHSSLPGKMPTLTRRLPGTPLSSLPYPSPAWRHAQKARPDAVVHRHSRSLPLPRPSLSCRYRRPVLPHIPGRSLLYLSY